MEGFLKVKTHICCCFLFKFCTCILKKECMKTLFQIGNHQRPQKKASETTEDEKTVKSETAAHKPTSQCGSCLRQLVKPQLKAKPLHAFAHSSLWFISTCIVHSLWKSCWFVTVLDHAAGRLGHHGKNPELSHQCPHNHYHPHPSHANKCAGPSDQRSPSAFPTHACANLWASKSS